MSWRTWWMITAGGDGGMRCPWKLVLDHQSHVKTLLRSAFDDEGMTVREMVERLLLAEAVPPFQRHTKSALAEADPASFEYRSALDDRYYFVPRD